MDEGTSQTEQHNGFYQFLPVSNHPRHVAQGRRRRQQQQQPQPSPACSPEGSIQLTVQSERHGRARAQVLSGSTSSRRRIDRSTGTAGSQFHPQQHHRSVSSLSEESLQNVAFQLQQQETPLSPESVEHAQTRQHFGATQQQIDYSQVSQGGYDPSLIYDFNQSSMAAQMHYAISMPDTFTPHQADSLASQFDVSQQYFPPEEGSQYLSTQDQLVTYQQQEQQHHLSRRMEVSSNITTMNPYNPSRTSGHFGQQPHPQQRHQQRPHQPQQQQQPQPQRQMQDVTNLEEAHNQYQRVLVMVLGYIQRSHLSEASRILLDLSAWLIDNARDLGLFRDDPSQHVKHAQLWNDFNICWLSLCQKQKDLSEAILGTGQPLPPTLLNAEAMEKMGQEIIRFCDSVEPHGLVDYQMGIWEEEILDILGQCLDLIEQ